MRTIYLVYGEGLNLSARDHAGGVECAAKLCEDCGSTLTVVNLLHANYNYDALATTLTCG